ncbi:hypothetical protein LJK87_42410 [Paenibacillus sp. P25]|nr:hypothetical protein LJK87_42410 [Paenibacillus sp. P25]
MVIIIQGYGHFVRCAAAAGLLAACLSAFPITAAAFYLKTVAVFVVEDAPIYSKPDDSAKPVGIVSGLQTVRVIDAKEKDDSSGKDQWFEIETWLGDQWIKQDQRLINGGFKEEDRTATIVRETAVFDKPAKDALTDVRLAPQPLHVTGSLSYAPFQAVNATGANASSGIWYRIDTKLGTRWIPNPDFLEDVHANQVSYDLKLTGPEKLYPHPFVASSDVEEVQPQVVQVTGEWDHRNGPWGSVWYRLQTGHGERWVAPVHPALREYREVNDAFLLKTATRYFQEPAVNLDGKDWLDPGTYQAFEATGDWVHIRTTHGEVWVNPKRALLERPEGIVKTDETIELTQDSETFRFPLTGNCLTSRAFMLPKPCRLTKNGYPPMVRPGIIFAE